MGSHVNCWSTVFHQVQNQCSRLPGYLEHLLPSADKLYGGADFIFQDDLAPAHTAKSTDTWFNDHRITVRITCWPANSPDLNAIDNVWAILKRKMRETRTNNADELKAAIWASDSMAHDLFRHLCIKNHYVISHNILLY